MIFRQLTVAGDWTFGKGINNFATDDQAIGLNIETKIKSWFGDCFFAQTEGIDWINRLGSLNQDELLQQDLKMTILKSFGVVAINSFEITLNDRIFSAKYDIVTVNSKSYKDVVEVTA